MLRKFIAEFLGTAILVTFGCGAAAWGVSAMPDKVGASYVGIAVAFGLVIVALAYSIGNISGCHVNPAVSFAMLINGKLTPKEFCGYVISQFLGACMGSLIMITMFLGEKGDIVLRGYGTNGFGRYSEAGVGLGGAVIAEIVLTFVFVFAICGVTSIPKFERISGIVIGFTLTLVHLVGLPLTGTSVNPARSFGAALGAALSGFTDPMKQVWVFIVAPMFGAALAALCWKVLSSEEPAPAEAPARFKTEVGKVREIKRPDPKPSASKAKPAEKKSESKPAEKKTEEKTAEKTEEKPTAKSSGNSKKKKK